MNKKIPFFRNPGKTHCFQACMKMLAKYYWPNKNYSWEELDCLSGKTKGLWTWIMAGSLWLINQGLEVRDIEIFDYNRFIEEKEKYLIFFYGEEAGKKQIKYSNLKQEIVYAKKFIEKNLIEKRIPNKEDIIKLLKNNYLIVCSVNQQILNNKRGYIGHFVLITGFDDKGYILHDPGLPAFENRKVNYQTFEKAWAYPDSNIKNILAFRLLNHKD